MAVHLLWKEEVSVPEPGSAAAMVALRRIAFLLERSRAETHRVRAFRNAAAAIAALDPAELSRRADAGSLKELPGVGAVTAAVVTEALTGAVPAYLQKLEDSADPTLVEGGEALRTALRGDLHMHSDWSDGGSPIEEMVVAGIDVGHDYVVLTDHSPRLTVARGLTAERLTAQLDVVDAINAQLGDRFTLLKGIEVDILDDGSLDQTEQMLDQLDVVVASVHSKLRMDSTAMTRRMVNAVRDPHTTVLGHCTGRSGSRPPSDFDARAVFDACAESDVAVEINSRPERRDPPFALIAVALEAGCLFSIDSDAHAPGQLDFLDYGCARAVEAGVPTERIVNTWSRDDLLAWAGR